MAYLMVINANKRRQLAQEKAKNEASFIRDILRRFDVSKTKTLKFEELRAWLQFLARSQGVPKDHAMATNDFGVEFPGASAGLDILIHNPTLQPHKQHPSTRDEDSPECVVTDDEVEWIFMLAMDRKEAGSYQRYIAENGPEAVKLMELPPADFECSLRAWRSYVQNKRLLTEVMDRYGTNAEGEMDRDSVRRMLTDLNGGQPPKESALDWVMAEAAAMPHSPGISAPELIKVMSLWYTKDLKPARFDDPVPPGAAGKPGPRPAAPAREIAGAPPGDGRRAPLAEAGGCGPGKCSIS